MTDTDRSGRHALWCWFLSASFATLSLLSSPISAYGQGQLLGAIHGTVKDQQGGVLPGVLVTAIPIETRPTITATTDAAGFYVLRDLPPGEYDVTAELTGFATLVQRGVLARAGRTLALDLAIAVGSFAERTIVERDAPLLETSSAATAVNISGDLQRGLPLSPRKNWSDFLLLTPGAMSTESSFGGLTFNYYMHGSDFTSHVLQIDGADVAAPRSGQTFNVALSTEAIADVQVSTAGVDASAPLGQGVIVSLATRSGTNRVSGSGAVSYQPRKWNSSNTPGGTSAATAAIQPEFSLGGPLLRDRAWLFGAYRRTSSDAAAFRTSAELAILQALDPAFRARDNRTRGDVYFVKATAAATPTQHLSAFYQRDVTSFESVFSMARPFLQSAGGNAVSARLSSLWSNSLTSQVNVSYNNKTFELPPVEGDGPSQNVFRSVTESAGTLSGTGFLVTLGAPVQAASDVPSDKLTLAVDIDYSLQRGLGRHSIRTGLYLQPRLNSLSRSIYVNDGFAGEDLVLRDSANPSSGTMPFRRIFYDAPLVTIDDRASDLAFYVQDNWSPSSRLTVNAGVRVDHVRSRNRIFNVTTQTSTDIGPRLGTLYRLTDTGHDTIHATWGRIHSKVTPVSISVGMVTAGSRTQYDLNLDGTFETEFVTPGTTRSTTNLVIDPSLHQPFVDEFTVGYRHQFPRRILVDIGYLDRRWLDSRTTVDVNSVFEGPQFLGYRDLGQNQIYNLTNNRWNTRVTKSLNISATHQTDSTQFLASYSRQWRHVTGTWQPNDTASILQPDAFPNDRGIGSTQGNFSSGYNATSLSLLNAATFTDGSPWRDHVLRLGLMREFPLGFVAAVNYTYQTGPWSGPLFYRLDGPDPRFGAPTLVLPNGRIVSNPLADTLRFVGPTRSDGQFSLPSYQALNAAVGYLWKVGGIRLKTTMDVFNVLNNDADQGLLTGATNTSDPNYGLSTNRQRPRGAQLSLRCDW